MSEEIKKGLYLNGDHYHEILKIMENQLKTRAGIAKSNLEINYTELLENKGIDIPQNVLYAVVESLLFEINSK